MFRIAFQTKGAFWVVQLLQYGFFWTTVADSDNKPLEFETYDSARDYCNTQGIPKAYEEQGNYVRHVMNGGRQ